MRQGDRYWLFTEAGELVIARLTPEGYEEIDRAKVIEPTAVANGRDMCGRCRRSPTAAPYIRNDEEIIARRPGRRRRGPAANVSDRAIPRPGALVLARRGRRAGL